MEERVTQGSLQSNGRVNRLIVNNGMDTGDG